MKPRFLLFIFMMALSLLVPFVHSHAYYKDYVPNGVRFRRLGHDESKGVPSDSTLHLSNFGNRFYYGFSEAWSIEFCEEDTDGDGYTNGQELGDPTCSWKRGEDAHPSCTPSDPRDSSIKGNCGDAHLEGITAGKLIRAHAYLQQIAWGFILPTAIIIHIIGRKLVGHPKR